jgi:hypothetical protein
MKKEYRVSSLSLLFYYSIASIFVVAGVVILLFAFFNPEFPDPFGRWFLVFWGSVALFVLLPQALKMPRRIIFDESGTLTFFSLISKNSHEINSLRSIKTSFANSYLLYFKFNNGKQIVINNVTNMYELIGNIKRVNPDIETNGC